MSLGGLVVHLAANISQYASDLGKAAHLTDQRMAEIQRSAARAGQVIGAAMVAAAGTMAVMVKMAINNADAMGKMAQAAGISTAAFSELAYAAKLSDVSTEELATSITRLNKNLVDAAGGSKEASKGFELLGINVKNADGSIKNADQAIGEIADKFAEMEDGPTKAALAVMFFGRAGAQMIPMLNQGSKEMARLKDEARALGATIDTETGRAAERFNDNLTRLNTVKQGLANTIMQMVLPQLNAFTEALVQAAKQGTAFQTAGEGIKVILQTIAVVGSDVVFVFRALGTGIGSAIAQLDALRRFDFKGFKLIREETEKDLARMRKELDEFQAQLMQTGAYKPTPSGGAMDMFGSGNIFNRPKPGPVIPNEAAAKEAERRAQEIRDIQHRVQTENDARELAQIKLQQEEIERLQEHHLKFMGDAAVENAADELAAVEEVWPKIMAIRAEAARSFVESAQIEQDRIDGLIYTYNRFGQQVEMTAEAYKEMLEAQKSTQKVAHELGFTFQSAFEDAIIAGNELRDVIRGLGQDIARIILRRTITEPLATGISGWLATSFGAQAGAGQSHLAAGGPAMAGRAYLVGEQGPELFVPGSSGSVVPNGEFGGISISHGDINITGNGVTRSEVAMALEAQHRRTIASVRELQRR